MATKISIIARASRFDVQFNVPFVLIPYVKTSRHLNFRCETASLPGRTLNTVDRRFGSAPAQKVPVGTTYNEMDLTFIVSDDMSEKVLFEGWIEAINPTTTYNFNYRANYVSDIVITQYDVSNKPSYQVTLLEAFPIAVNQLDLDWTSENHHKLTVVLAYTNWQATAITDIAKQLETQILTSITQ